MPRKNPPVRPDEDDAAAILAAIEMTPGDPSTRPPGAAPVEEEEQASPELPDDEPWDGQQEDPGYTEGTLTFRPYREPVDMSGKTVYVCFGGHPGRLAHFVLRSKNQADKILTQFNRMWSNPGGHVTLDAEDGPQGSGIYMIWKETYLFHPHRDKRIIPGIGMDRSR